MMTHGRDTEADLVKRFKATRRAAITAYDRGHLATAHMLYNDALNMLPDGHAARSGVARTGRNIHIRMTDGTDTCTYEQEACERPASARIVIHSAEFSDTTEDALCADHAAELRASVSTDGPESIVIDITWAVAPAPVMCAYSIACDQPATHTWNVAVPGPVPVCNKDRKLLIGWKTPATEFAPLPGLNKAVRWDEIHPGMSVKPVGGLGGYRQVDEIERIGARVIIGYADDELECGRYPDTQWFLVQH